MGQASPQPMVITTSAARTAASVIGLGNALPTSIPSSAIATTTAGLIRSAGSLPADRTLHPTLGVVVDQRGGHLAAAGVVDAHEQHLGHVRAAYPLTDFNSIDRSRSMAIDLPLAPKQKRPAGQPCCEPVVYPDIEREQAERMATIAKALGDPIRLQLVDVLRKHAGQVCVCELVPLFDLSQPTVSHHLKVLRAAGSWTASAAGCGPTTTSSPRRWRSFPHG